MDGRKEKAVDAVVRLYEEEIQQARWNGWSSSSSWSRVLGILSALMNNGEEARRRRGKKRQWRQEGEEEGTRHRCSSDWRGGSSTGFASLLSLL